MKKLITILAILVVLVGTVFATDPAPQSGSAVIDITATIEEVTPFFVLRLTKDDAVKSAATSEVKASSPTHGESGLSEASIEALSAGTAVTVSFDIFQRTMARLSSNATLNHSYTFTITATDLILQVNSANVSSPANNQKFGVVQAHPAVNALETNAAAAQTITQTQGQTAITTATVTGSAAGTGTLGVVYDGMVPASTILGNFQVSWNGNIAAVPGDYKATVTMEVTSV